MLDFFVNHVLLLFYPQIEALDHYLCSNADLLAAFENHLDFFHRLFGLVCAVKCVIILFFAAVIHIVVIVVKKFISKKRG